MGSGSSIELKWYTLKMNKKLIWNMAKKDKIDGVFIDECTSYPDIQSKKYLKELSNLAHNLGLMVWGNVGLNDFDEWFFTDGGFDMMNSSENWCGQILAPVQQKWGYRICVTGFHPAYTAADACRLTRDAWNKGLSCAYISNDEYMQLPVWIQDEISLLRTG